MVALYNVTVVIHGDAPESGTTCAFAIPGQSFTLKNIRTMFPYQGNFHFRIFVPGNVIGISNNYVWVDLIDENDEIIYFIDNKNEGEIVDIKIRAIIVDIDSTETDQIAYDEYLLAISRNISSNRPERYPIETNSQTSHQENTLFNQIKSGVKKATASNVQNINLKTVKQGASTVWNSFLSTATQLQQNWIQAANTSMLSDASEENLSRLSEDLAIVYTDNNSEHVQLLKDMWSALFSNESFERETAKWKDAGFQRLDPVLDLKTSGILALRTITYLGKTYPLKTNEMLERNKANTKTNYPFAIVGVNVTLLLTEVLNLRDQKYLATSAGYWEIFENTFAFYEIFCAIFFHIDTIWTSSRATRTDFSKIIGN